MILHYILTAWRCSLKYKTQNLISILGLSVALLCFSICLYCSRYIYNTNHCFDNRDRLVQMTTVNKDDGYGSSHTFCDFSEELEKLALPEVEAYIYINYVDARPYNIEVSANKQLPYTLQFMETMPSYYEAFGPNVLFGSWEQAAHTPNSVILSESTAKRIFGQAERAIGKQMFLTSRLQTSPKSTPSSGGIAYTIQAVMEDLPKNNSLNFLRPTDAWVLNDSEGILNSWLKRSMMAGQTLALLKKGVSTEEFIRNTNARKQEYNFFGREQYLFVRPFEELFWKESPAFYYAITTLVAGILILLVGMLNFFHFLIGSYITRIREYSLRQVHGAKGYQLWTMLLTQSTLSILCSGLFTMVLMELLTPFLFIDLGKFVLYIERPELMKQAGTYLLGLWGCCMLAAWIVVWRVKRITILKGLFGGGGVYGKHRIRNVLLGIQFFICWIFVSLTAMLYLQSQKSANTILSTLSQKEKEEIFSIPMREYTFLTQEERMNLISEMGKVAGVKAVLPSETGYISGVTSTMIFTQPERKEEYLKQITVIDIDSTFYEFMNIPILSGVIPKNEHEIVVSKGFEEMMGKDMLGQMLYDWEMKGNTVTAICQPIIQSIQKMPDRYKQDICMFKALEKEHTYHCYVKCEPGQKKRVGEGLTKVLRQHLPENIDIKLNTLMDDIRKAQAMEFELREIAGFFSIVSILIILLGVYAAITLDTEYRRKEMAIRKVNGAGGKDIALIFARLYIWLLMVTALLAFPVVEFIIKKFSSSYAVFVNTDIGFYASIFLGIAVVIALTVGFRIYRITQVNPAEIIRKE